MLWCNEPLQEQTHLLHHNDIMNRLLSINNLTHMFFYGISGCGKTTLIRFFLQHIFKQKSFTYQEKIIEIPNKKKKIYLQKTDYFQIIDFESFDKTHYNYLIIYLRDLIHSKTVVGKKRVFYFKNIKKDPEFFTFLKYTIEKFSHNNIFIVSSFKQIMNKKLDGLFVNIRVPKLNDTELSNILQQINKQKRNHKKKLNKKTIATIIKTSDSHLSKAITLLQLKTNNKYEYKQYIQRTNNRFLKLSKLLQTTTKLDHFNKFREFIYDYSVIDNSNLLLELTEYLLTQTKLKKYNHEIVKYASTIDWKSQNSKKMICYELFLINLSLLFDKKKDKL